MVERPDTLTVPEIAAAYDRSPHTITKLWARHPEWPASTGRRGQHKTYDADAVAAFVREHIERPPVALEPARLYTAKEIEQLTGITAATIRADRSKGRWPAPDDTQGRAHAWKGSTVTQALAGRRSYRKTQEG